MKTPNISALKSDYSLLGNNLLSDAITANRITSDLQFSKGLRIQPVNAEHYYL
jgi:hypothetical protein